MDMQICLSPEVREAVVECIRGRMSGLARACSQLDREIDRAKQHNMMDSAAAYEAQRKEKQSTYELLRSALRIMEAM